MRNGSGSLNSYNLADEVAISQVYKGIMKPETPNWETRKIIVYLPMPKTQEMHVSNKYLLLKNYKYKTFNFSLLIY